MRNARILRGHLLVNFSISRLPGRRAYQRWGQEEDTDATCNNTGNGDDYGGVQLWRE